MRRTLSLPMCASLVLVTFAFGCEPAPANDGRFWIGRTVGSGGSDPIVGTGGDTGSGGATNSGGTFGSGGAGAAKASGGSIGTGNMTGTGGKSGSGGIAGSGASAPSGGATGSGGGAGMLPGTLQISVTTKAAGGQYAPVNVGAIWIADSNTKFVKSLYVWGSQRRKELSTWISATSAAGVPSNLVDAVTAASMRSHGVRTATWNGTDVSKALVPDGSYKVCFELRDGKGQSQCVDFMKSRTAQTLMPADTTSFTNRSIGYTP